MPQSGQPVDGARRGQAARAGDAPRHGRYSSSCHPAAALGEPADCLTRHGRGIDSGSTGEPYTRGTGRKQLERDATRHIVGSPCVRVRSLDCDCVFYSHWTDSRAAGDGGQFERSHQRGPAGQTGIRAQKDSSSCADGDGGCGGSDLGDRRRTARYEPPASLQVRSRLRPKRSGQHRLQGGQAAVGRRRPDAGLSATRRRPESSARREKRELRIHCSAFASWLERLLLCACRRPAPDLFECCRAELLRHDADSVVPGPRVQLERQQSLRVEDHSESICRKAVLSRPERGGAADYLSAREGFVRSGWRSRRRKVSRDAIAGACCRICSHSAG